MNIHPEILKLDEWNSFQRLYRKAPDKRCVAAGKEWRTFFGETRSKAPSGSMRGFSVDASARIK